MMICIILVCSAFLSSCVRSSDEKDASSTKTVSSTLDSGDTAIASKYAMSDVENMTAPGVLPIVVKPVTLTVGIQERQVVTDYENNGWTRYLQDNTGIDIEFYFLPSNGTEAIQKLELLVSSNSELPDVIYNLYISSNMRHNYGAQGYFLPINDYLNKYSYYFDEMLAKENSNIVNNIKKLGLSPDGNQYGFVNYSNAPTDRCYTQMHMNVNWLNKLNLKKPTTTDELYEVLLAFRDRDPNQNGLKDEIPLYGTTTWSTKVDLTLLQCFTYWNEDGLHVKDGELFPLFTTDAYREGIAYMARLCAENLLSPLSFTQSSEQARVLLNPPKDSPELVGTICGYQLFYFTAGEEDHKYSYEAIPLLLNPYGTTNAMYSQPGISYPFFITKYCKTPEIAFRWLDFQMSDESMMSARFGIKGKDWDYVEKGSMESMFSGIGKTADRRLFANVNGGTSTWATPCGYVPQLSFGLAKSYSAEGEVESLVQKDNDWFTTHEFENFYARWGKWPEITVGTINYTDAEVLEINEIRSVIMTYIQEARVAFITGEKNINTEWENYLDELESIGLSKYLEVAQKAYTRDRKSVV